MAKIQTYALTNSPLLLSDMLIGTEMDGLIPFATKNFSLGQLYSFFSSLDPFFDLQYVLDNGNFATQNIYLTGYMEINGELKPDIILDENNSPGLFGQALIRSASGLIWADINPESTLQDVLDNGNYAIGNLILNGTITASVIKPGNILDQGNASGNNGQVLKKNGSGLAWSDVLSSIGLSMPSAFTVTNSPLTSDGIIYVTGAGLANQYIRGDGTLANFPSSWLNDLNGLTAQVQYFATGASGTDFNISSSVDTHTFNLPTASATKRGALSSTDWTTFNSKQDALTKLYDGTQPLKYCGVAPLGSLTSAPVWRITRLTIAVDGSVVSSTVTNAIWDNRYIIIYP
jgi:hypothetical protein